MTDQRNAVRIFPQKYCVMFKTETTFGPTGLGEFDSEADAEKTMDKNKERLSKYGWQLYVEKSTHERTFYP